MNASSILFWSLFATVLACIEIESEGKWGWAEKAPTWYRTTGLPAKLYGLCMGGKPLTGYHAFMFLLPIFIFHAHFAMGVEWTIVRECGTWALYFAWCVLWDYHWFVLNPHYAHRFNRQNVWWHAKSPWIAGLFPLDYLMGVGLSVGLAAVEEWLGSRGALLHHLKTLGGFALYTLALHFVAPIYHAWYWRMRKKDDRNKVRIFHSDA